MTTNSDSGRDSNKTGLVDLSAPARIPTFRQQLAGKTVKGVLHSDQDARQATIQITVQPEK
jgi:hypothetical protein